MYIFLHLITFHEKKKSIIFHFKIFLEIYYHLHNHSFSTNSVFELNNVTKLICAYRGSTTITLGTIEQHGYSDQYLLQFFSIALPQLSNGFPPPPQAPQSASCLHQIGVSY